MENEAHRSPTRQVPELRVQTDTGLSPERAQGSFGIGSAFQHALLSPVLDPQSSVGKAVAAHAPPQAATEFRKLLGVALGNLQHRRRPPPVYDDFRSPAGRRDGTKMGIALTVIRAAARFDNRPAASIRSSQGGGSDSEEEGQDSETFSTDATVEHVTKLREVLVVSESQGWNILSG